VKVVNTDMNIVCKRVTTYKNEKLSINAKELNEQTLGLLAF